MRVMYMSLCTSLSGNREHVFHLKMTEKLGPCWQIEYHIMFQPHPNNVPLGHGPNMAKGLWG